MPLSANIQLLHDRAAMLGKARSFFHSRGILEVDCPQITQAASIDAHIDLIPTEHLDGRRFLHSSPEYGMKRLLSEGIGDIYQLSHVFRQGEISAKHNPEFMMAEWYRLGYSYEQMIAETLDFIRLFLGQILSETISYREAFRTLAGIDYLSASSTDLLEYIHKKAIPIYPGIENEGKDALLNIILGVTIEPFLGKDTLCVLTCYPSSQAALAQTRQVDHESVAERFEVYFQGVELANGYHELADPFEQKRRLDEANEARTRLGKDCLPVDQRFLSALSKGLPDCSGVAVGFDRLMMLKHGAPNISSVIPFAWDEA